MAGMRALGRVYDVVSAPSGININTRECSGVGLLAVNGTSTAAVLTITASTKFSGGTTKNWTTANGFGQTQTGYTRIAALTSGWVSQSLAAAWSSNVLTVPITTTGAAFYVDILVSQFADTYDYINVTVSGSGCTLPAMFLYDLTVQRTPANLVIPAA